LLTTEAARRAKTKWRLANPDKQRAAVARCAAAKSEQYATKKAEWRAANPDKVRAIRARQDAKPHRKSQQRGDREAIRLRYKKKHLEKIRVRRCRYQADRRADPVERLVDAIRRRMRLVINGKSKGVFKSLGCTADDLRGHLELQFRDGMSWENYGLYGNKWHLDHIRPVCSFKLPDDLAECFALSNLQPLWAKDNLAKHAKVGGCNSLANS
jgi:hypothetical protein